MVTGYELPTRHIIGANGHICCVNWPHLAQHVRANS